jgi:hypothetical protein
LSDVERRGRQRSPSASVQQSVRCAAHTSAGGGARGRVQAEELRLFAGLYKVTVAWLAGEITPGHDAKVELAARELGKLKATVGRGREVPPQPGGCRAQRE